MMSLSLCNRYGWVKNDEIIVDNSPEGDLVLERLTDEQEGYYQCFANNSLGLALTHKAHLRMASKRTPLSALLSPFSSRLYQIQLYFAKRDQSGALYLWILSSFTWLLCGILFHRNNHLKFSVAFINCSEESTARQTHPTRWGIMGHVLHQSGRHVKAEMLFNGMMTRFSVTNVWRQSLCHVSVTTVFCTELQKFPAITAGASILQQVVRLGQSLTLTCPSLNDSYPEPQIVWRVTKQDTGSLIAKGNHKSRFSAM